VHVGHERLNGSWKQARTAYQLGARLVNDIRSRRCYPLQNLMKRIITRVAVRPMIAGNIRDHKDGTMKAVYETLAAQGVIR
jgi:hypothetical protein